MNQAQRYEHLVGLTEGKKLDSDYRAAFYIKAALYQDGSGKLI